MAFEAPWAIDGVEITADDMRAQAHSGADGREGVIAATDLAVRQLDQAGAAVQVLPGSFNALNRSPGYTGQMYTDRVREATQVEIAGTGSGGGRSDMVVARILDPNMPGGPQEADAEALNYAAPEVISGVSSSARTLAQAGKASWSAYPLARIDIPAGMGVITQDMITDLRQVAKPNRDRTVYTYALVTAQAEAQTATGAAGEYWPNLARWDLTVPEWATRAKVVATWAGVVASANAVGRVWVGIGTQDAPNTKVTQEVRYDYPTGGATRIPIIASDDIAIPREMRGTVQRFGMRARKESGTSITVDWGSSLILDVEFVEQPVSEQIGV